MTPSPTASGSVRRQGRPARVRGFRQRVLLGLALLAGLWMRGGLAQGTAFTYQGRLNEGGIGATGVYDLSFSLHGSSDGGDPLHGPAYYDRVGVTNGLFTVALDFGDGCFDGTAYWLEMGVRQAGGSRYQILAPRRPILPAPYAVFATTAGQAGAVDASGIRGTLSIYQLPYLAVDGSGLSRLNASRITSGTLADARLSGNVVLRDATQELTGTNRFAGPVVLTNAANQIAGRLAGDGAGITNLAAAALGGAVAAATHFTAPLQGDVTGPQAATVVDQVGGLPAAVVAGGVTLARAATPASVPDVLVRRDAVDAGFSAGTIRAGRFVGDGAGLTNLPATALVGTAPAATNFTAPLQGDVTGPQAATVVGQVGGVPAATVATGVALAQAATPGNVCDTLVRRDPADASFSAGTIRAERFVGDGSGLTNLPTSASQYVAPRGALLASPLAADPDLLAAGYRLLMSMPAPGWTSGATLDAPSPRSLHTAVWDGRSMVVWGGLIGPGTPTASGALYDPEADAWTPMTTVNAPSARSGHTAVWSGTQMIVWGGLGAVSPAAGGGRFTPASQTWSPVAVAGAPSARGGHVAVWTGSRMVVWGGRDFSGLLDDGGVYDPASNTWTPLPTAGAPERRMDAVAVWGNDRLLVWGGEGEGGLLDTGGELGFLNGAPTSWTALTVANAPLARVGHTAVWAGDRMIVWGGQAGGLPLGDGAAYCPGCGGWTPVAPLNAPAARFDHAAVWSGAEMVIVGGRNAGGDLASAAAYDPVTLEWRPLSARGNPLARSRPGVVWTTTDLLVFGGAVGDTPVAALQRLFPQPEWHFYRKL